VENYKRSLTNEEEVWARGNSPKNISKEQVFFYRELKKAEKFDK
jgi:hypothetical protein